MEKSDRVLLVGSIVLLAVVGGMALRPDGVVGFRLAEWKSVQTQRRVIAASWIELSMGARLGDSTNVRLIEFGDYQCPYCRTFHGELERFLDEHLDVGLVYRHLPLTSIHEVAMDAARAATCGGRQGVFPAVHKTLYETDHWMEDRDWSRVGKTAKVGDVERFLACIRDRETDGLIEADLQLAATLDISSTPSLVLRDGIQTGAISSRDLADLLKVAVSETP